MSCQHSIIFSGTGLAYLAINVSPNLMDDTKRAMPCKPLVDVEFVD